MRRRRIQLWRGFGIGIVAATTVVVVGCSSGSPEVVDTARTARRTDAPTTTLSVAEGWLWRASGETMFLSLLTVGTSVSGTAQVAYLSDDRVSVETRTGAITGSVAGSQVVLDVLGQTWSGRFETDGLVLSILDANGRLRDVHLVPGDGHEFNTEVERIEETARENEHAAQVAAEAEADASYRWSIYTQTQAATRDIADVLDFSGHWPDATNQIALLQDAVAAAATSDCYYAGYDYSSAEYTLSSLEYTLSDVDAQLETIGERIAHLEPLIATLDSLLGGADGGDLAFASADAEVTIATARTVVSEQTAMIDAVRAQATDLVAQVKRQLTQRCGDFS